MNLAKLLKEKNRTISELGIVKERILRENKTEGENKSKYDLKAEFAKMTELTDRLVAIKTEIARLNATVAVKIFALSELKSHIAYLKSLDTQEGTFTSANYHATSTMTYSVQIDKVFVDAEVAKATKLIDVLQEELDSFNHTTQSDFK